MILMASDHASGAYNAGRLVTDSVLLYDPQQQLGLLQFSYRWISHLCAPTFLFLAGTALALSIERKIRGYDAHQSQFDVFDASRYVVLFVTTRSQQRLAHMLSTARLCMQNPQRRVFLGVCLDRFVADRVPLTRSCFQDVRGRSCPLIDNESLKETSPTFVTPTVVPC